MRTGASEGGSVLCDDLEISANLPPFVNCSLGSCDRLLVVSLLKVHRCERGRGWRNSKRVKVGGEGGGKGQLGFAGRTV